MGKKTFLIIEILLILIYLGLVLFVIDTSTVMGLVFVGIATVVIFPIVLIMEKKREKMGDAPTGTQTPTETAKPVETTQPAAEAPAPTQPQGQQPPQQ